MPGSSKPLWSRARLSSSLGSRRNRLPVVDCVLVVGVDLLNGRVCNGGNIGVHNLVGLLVDRCVLGCGNEIVAAVICPLVQGLLLPNKIEKSAGRLSLSLLTCI